jgi:hypothetical protein
LQRNVGILEKIVASLTANTAASRTNKSELQMQYKTQVDVVEQLGDKVLRLCREQSVHTNNASTSSSSTTKTALIKLQRDFERVQSRAMALQQKVTQTMAAAAAAQQQDAEALSSNNPNQAYEDYQRQVQMQLQQDVSLFFFKPKSLLKFRAWPILTHAFLYDTGGDRDWTNPSCANAKKSCAILIAVCIK